MRKIEYFALIYDMLKAHLKRFFLSIYFLRGDEYSLYISFI